MSHPHKVPIYFAMFCSLDISPDVEMTVMVQLKIYWIFVIFWATEGISEKCQLPASTFVPVLLQTNKLLE